MAKVRRGLDRFAVNIMTVNCLDRLHGKLMGYHFNDLCRRCKDVEEEESNEHYSCPYPALTSGRSKFREQYCFDCLVELALAKIRNLVAFIMQKKWFGHMRR